MKMILKGGPAAHWARRALLTYHGVIGSEVHGSIVVSEVDTLPHFSRVVNRD